VPPASTGYASSGSGDGWDVAVSQDQVYNAFHHQQNLTVACHSLSDASVCAGWPKSVTDSQSNNYTTSQHPGAYLDRSTGRLYVFVTRLQDKTAGVACVDTTQPATNPNPFCGFTPLTPANQANLVSAAAHTQVSALSAPMLVGHRWYSFNYFGGQPATGAGADNELLCFDLSTDAACAGQPFAVNVGSGTVGSLGVSPLPAAIGSKLVIPVRFGTGGTGNILGNDELACFDTTTNGNCNGAWPVSTQLSFIGSTGAPFPMLDGGGNVTGVCLANGNDPCYTLSGATASTPPGLATTTGQSSFLDGPAYVLGPRVYLANANTTTVSCYDYSTSPTGPCPNFPKALSGIAGQGVYTVSGDPQLPTCLWVNSDSGTGQIQNFDAYTGGPCTQGRVLASEFVVPQPQCVPSSYQSLQVTSPTPGAYDSASVQFLDGDGNPIAGLSPQPLDSNGRVDLTGLTLNTGTGMPQFEITLNGWPPPTGAAPVTVMLSWTGTNDPACAPARPVTTDDAPTGWQNQPVTVHLTAAEPGGSGVASTHYSVDGGPDQTGTNVTIPAPSDHSNDGSHTITYYSVDRDGNQETPHTATVLIDTTSPTTTDDAPTGPQTSDVTVDLTATDPANPDGSAASGVANTFYSVDGGPLQSGNAVTIPASEIGLHTIKYYSVDNAGNPEAPHYATVLMAPPQTISFSSTPPSNAVYGGSYPTVAATATSGLPVTLSIDPSSTSGACTLTGTTVSFTGVGTCVIDADQAGNDNYAPAPQVQQTFTVGPVPLTVTASSGTMTAGSPVPGITAAYAGWVNGDTAASAMSDAPTCTTSATSSSPVGTDPTSCSGGTFSPNYAPQYVSGTLTVTPGQQAITYTTSPPANPTYAGSYSVAATTSSGLPVTLSIDPSSTSGACSLSGSTVSFTGVGTCVIDADQPGNDAYTAAPQVQQTFTIGPVPLTVTASSGTMTAGSPVPEITAAYAGWVNGDTAASAMSAAPTCTTSATASSPVGTDPTSCRGGTFSANYAPQYVSGTLTIAPARTSVDLSAKVDAGATFTRTYGWSIAKGVDKTLVVHSSAGPATFNYTVKASQTGVADSNWRVTGKVHVTNPNKGQAITADVSASVADGGTCSVSGGTGTSVPAASTVDLPYTCTYASAPTQSGQQNATAQVTWDKGAAATPDGSTSATGSYAFGAPTTTDNPAVTVTDAFNGGAATTLGTVTAVNAAPFASTTFTYARTITVSAKSCVTAGNTAQLMQTGQSSSKTVQGCALASTGDGTIGFWQNKNGQGLITGSGPSSGTSALATWLRQYAPFQDLSATATPSAVASYVTSVIKAASGSNMNTMLKAQMLGSALNVYFSDPSLGGDKTAAPGPLGGLGVDLTNLEGTSENGSAAFGGAKMMTASDMLAYAAGQSNAGGTTWYGNVKATQTLAKDAFETINKGIAVSP
jgi:hypothetical protein